MNLSCSPLYDLGVLDAGEAVKFTAPKPGWKLQKVNVVGWSGYNETTETLLQTEMCCLR